MLEDKIDVIRSRNEILSSELSKPEVLSNPQKLKKIAREHNELNQIIEFYDKLLSLTDQIDEDQLIINSNEDEDLVLIAKEEIEGLQEKQIEMEEELKHLLIPKDPNDTKNAIVEIRAGTGGDEAGIFAGDLYRMYSKFCEINGFKTETLSSNTSDKEA